YILPLGRLDAGPDRVDEGVAEYRHEIILFEDRPLDFLGQLLALRRLRRGRVVRELLVEVLDADRVGAEPAAAAEQRLVPIGPRGADAGAGKHDVEPGPFFEPALASL